MALFKIYSKVKPIFVVRFPKAFPVEEIDNAYNRLVRSLTGYHVLVYRDKSIKEVKFECFNCEFNEIEFNELKEQVLKSINNDITG
jgi:hypothetical protein